LAARPRVRRGRVRAHALSEADGALVDAFCDALWLEDGLSRNTIAAYRADLESLSAFMRKPLAKTLVSATDEDVREYISVSLACLRAFYGFSLNSGCRDDDPTEPERPARSTCALRRDREH